MLMPSIERIRFVSSGTEATMSAARVARAFTKRDKIVKFEGCYHGHADAFLVKAGSGAMTLGVPTSPGVPASAARDTLLARYNDLDSVERLFEQNRGEIAAVIVEPIAGNMGVVPPRDGFLEGLRKICSREGSLLIFDEVISGFRAAAGGAQQLFGVTPDLTCLGKIIGGGLPVGAYGGRADVMELLAPSGPVYQAGTLSGNPLAMTAGLWCLERAVRPPVSPPRKARRPARGRPGRRGARGRRADAGQRVRLRCDALLHVAAGPRLRVGSDRRYGRLRQVLSRDARARDLSAAVAVRGVVHLGGAHGAGCRQDDQGGEGNVRGNR